MAKGEGPGSSGMPAPTPDEFRALLQTLEGPQSCFVLRTEAPGIAQKGASLAPLRRQKKATGRAPVTSQDQARASSWGEEEEPRAVGTRG